MNKAVPWNVKGVGFEAREAAHIAARRAGIPVGEWLNSVIAEHARDLGVSADDFSADDRLDALVARLAGLAESVSAAENPAGNRADAARGRASTPRLKETADMAHVRADDHRSGPEEELDRLRGRAASSDDDESWSDRGARRASAGVAKAKPYLSDWDNDVLLDQALELVEKRSSGAERAPSESQRSTVAALAKEVERLNLSDLDRTGASPSAAWRPEAKINGGKSARPIRDAVGSVTERIEEIESRLAHRDADQANRPIVAALGRLEDRFEHLLRRNTDGAREAARVETTFRDFDSRLRDIALRLEGNGSRTTHRAAKTEDEGELAAILSRLDAVANKASNEPDRWEGDGPNPAPRAGRRSNRDAVAEIARRQFDLDQGDDARAGLMRGTSHPTIDQAQRESRREGKETTAASESEAFNGLQDAFARLSDRLEARLEAAQARTASVDDKSADITALKSGIAELAERLDVIRQENEQERVAKSDPEPIETLRLEITTLQRGLADLAPHSAIATLEDAVRQLGGQIDDSRRSGVSDAILAPIQRLQQEVHAAIANDGLSAKVGSVEQQLQAIAGRIEGMESQALDRNAFQDLHGQMRMVCELLASAALQFQAAERLEQELGRLTGRIERLVETPPRAAIRDLELAVNEIRTMMVRFSPESALQDVSRQLDQLGRRIGSLEEQVTAPDAMFDDFARRIEQANTALAERLTKAAPVVDLTPIEAMIGGLSGKIDGLRHASTDMQALGGLVRGLAAQIEEARLPSADGKILDTLETQVGRLAERLDRSDASLDAITSVERLIRELFHQIDDTRSAAIEAAEMAARNAAQETLRAALVSPSIAGEEASARATRVVEQVGQELAEFRKLQQGSERRVHSTLLALNETLERMVDRMMAETESPVRVAIRAPVAETLADSPASIEDRPEVESKEAVQQPPAATASTVSATEADAPAKPPESKRTVPTVPAVAPSVEIGRPGMGEPMPDVAPLIAAARRAAQAAQASATQANKDGVPKSRATSSPTVPVKGLKPLFGQKRRPVLLSIASVVLLLGAVQIVHLTQADHDAGPVDKTDTIASTATEPLASPDTALPAPEAVSPSAPAAAQATIAPAAPKPDAAKLPDAVPLAASSDPAPKALAAGLRERAERGDAASQYEVGARLADGRGIARDPTAAAGWFERAAKQGLAPAEYRLGSLYEKGTGIPAAPTQALTWYEKAASQGNVRAMHNLAVMAAEGSGAKSDYAKAATWFTKAAEHGVRDSQYNLAILYARGLGLAQDLSQSYTWFTIAAAQGDADAGKKRDDVAAKLEPAKLAAAKAAADGFKPQPVDKAANDVSPPSGGWDTAAPAKDLTASPKVSTM